MPKRTKTPTKSPSKKFLSRAERTAILSEAASKGWTAEQIAKKTGVSKWTVYGWRKNRSKARGGKPAKKNVARGSTVKAPARAAGSLGETLRPMIAELVRQELTKLIGAGR